MPWTTDEARARFHRGTWHHYSFSLLPEEGNKNKKNDINDDDSNVGGERTTDFLCIDRCGGDGNNCDEYYLKDNKKETAEAGKKRDSGGKIVNEEEEEEIVFIHSE